MIIALDGPAGAGKSTVARKIARTLSIFYLDTGAMYRAFTLYILEGEIPLDNKGKIEEALSGFNLDLLENKVILNGKNVTKAVRREDVTANVSYISSLNFVRKKMVCLQRKIGKNRDIIAEGRDIGTVVFQNADYKFYLDASIEERARRRLNDEKNENKKQSIGDIIKKIKKRDDYDSTRKVSPLKKAHDAIYIDSTNMTINEVCSYIINFIKNNNMGVLKYERSKEFTK